MRQFMSSQKVHLVTTENARKFHDSKVGKQSEAASVSDIITLGALNEEEKQKHENEKLAFVKIDAEIRRFVLDEVSSLHGETDAELIKELLDATSPLFIRSIKETPKDWLIDTSVREDTAKVLTDFSETRLKMLHNIVSKEQAIESRFNELRLRIQKLISNSENSPASLLYHLSGTIRPATSVDNGTEVQQQVETQTLVQLNLESLVDQSPIESKGTGHSKYLLKFLENPPNRFQVTNKYYADLTEIYAIAGRKDAYRPLVNNLMLTGGNGTIAASIDLIELISPVYGTEVANPYPIFSPYTNDGSHLLVQRAGEAIKTILLSVKYAHEIVADLEQTKDLKYSYWLCDLSGKISASSESKDLRRNIMTLLPSTISPIFDLLVFNGSLPQILADKNLANLYHDRWLADKSYSTNRAIFLLLRMRVLRKDKIIFEETDKEYVALQKYAKGEAKKDDQAQPLVIWKGAVSQDLQAKYAKDNVFVRDKGNDFDLWQELRAITLSGFVERINPPIQGSEELAEKDAGRTRFFAIFKQNDQEVVPVPHLIEEPEDEDEDDDDDDEISDSDSESENDTEPETPVPVPPKVPKEEEPHPKESEDSWIWLIIVVACCGLAAAASLLYAKHVYSSQTPEDDDASGESVLVSTESNSEENETQN